MMWNQPIVVTGGLGFIGSTFIRRMAERRVPVTNIDAHTYAADERRLNDLAGSVETLAIDLARDDLSDVVDGRPIVHFAAETHVTRSELDRERFYRSNVEGTRRLLEAVERAGSRIVHVSTDEVYGPAVGPAFREEDKLPGEGAATSAYARSKALADDLAAEAGTRGDVTIVRPGNCFGPWQHPEKAIARWTIRAIRGDPLPVWGDGRQIREWTFVEDVCTAVELILEDGEREGIYNVSAPNTLTNLEMATLIATTAGADPESVYLTAYDRPQHDRRYAIDSSKVRALGWTPHYALETGIKETVDWYRSNPWWWDRLMPEAEDLYSDDEARSDPYRVARL